jgi:hypothetical protein
MNTVLTLMDHVVPVIVTLIVVGFAAVFFVGLPYLHYTYLVANADSEYGIQELAKYLAHRTGGRKINVDDKWQSFVPAAKVLGEAYEYKHYVRKHTDL